MRCVCVFLLRGREGTVMHGDLLAPGTLSTIILISYLGGWKSAHPKESSRNCIFLTNCQIYFSVTFFCLNWTPFYPPLDNFKFDVKTAHHTHRGANPDFFLSAKKNQTKKKNLPKCYFNPIETSRGHSFSVMLKRVSYSKPLYRSTGYL